MPLSLQPERTSGGVRRGDLFVADDGRGRLSLRDCGGLVALPLAPAEGGGGTVAAADEKYYTRSFRLLSAVLITGHWVDLSNPSLFDGKESLFDAKTVLCDHKMRVAEWVGVTTNVRKSDRGGVVGMDGDLKIHREQDRVVFDGSIVRGLEMDPPAISSCSVTLEWRGHRSHEALDTWEFWCHLGEEVGGEIVRWVVDEIVRIHEVSLVYSGADPNARSFSSAGQGAPFMSKIAALVRDLHGVDPESEAGLQAVRDAHKLAAAARRISGKESAEQALGVLEAHATSHGRVAELQGQLANAEKELDKRERLALIDDAINGVPDGKGGRKVLMSPSQRAWAEGLGKEQLESYLASAPPLNVGSNFKPKAEPPSGAPARFSVADEQLFAQLNQQRRGQGQPELTKDEYLDFKSRQAAKKEAR